MKKGLDDWVRYSTLGIEMVVIIGGFVWLGVVIDRHRDSSFPVFTILFSIVGFAIAMTRLFRTTK